MKIDWWTLALQAINFLILVWLLSRFLFTPVKEVIEKRKALASKALAKAQAAQQQAEKEESRTRQERDKLKQERMALRKRLREEMEEEQLALLKEAETKAANIHSKAMEAIATERNKTLANMREDIIDLAVNMATSLLKRSAAQDDNEFYLKSLVNQLDQLESDELEKLGKDLSIKDSKFTIITAAALPADQQKHWRTQIAQRFKKMPKPRFVTDPDLVGGAVLRFPNSELRFSWKDQLNEARDLLLTPEQEPQDVS